MDPNKEAAHNAAMIAKVDAAHAASVAAQSSPMGVPPAGAPAADPPAKPQRPEHVPEKFWDADKGEARWEDMAKAYVELEKTRSQAPAAAPAATEQAAVDAVKAAKLDFATLNTEFARDGKISEASYSALEGAGVTREVVDSYIAGQVALAQAHDAKAYAAAGDKASYERMVAWAGTNLTAAEQEAFNTSVTGTEAQMIQAVTALKARFTAANGNEPKLTHGNTNAGTAGETPFASRAEVTQAMRDPRYAKDPAYRALVERRVGLMEVF